MIPPHSQSSRASRPSAGTGALPVSSPCILWVCSRKEDTMEIDTARIRDLLDKRDQIDAELAAAFVGTKKPIKCGQCGEEGHTARTCAKRVLS